MLYGALGFFALAAVLGLYLLSLVITNKETSKGVALIHGFFAVIGVTLLIIYPFLYSPAPITSLVLFLLAAVGGLTLFYKDLTGQKLPKWLALGHGMVAAIGFVLLAVFIFTK
jgi:hypothetical protein